MKSLFWPLVRNIGSSKLNRDKIGYRIEREFGVIRYDEALAYAKAIKDGSPQQQAPDGIVTPFFPSKLLSAMAKEMIALKGLNLNLLRMVHGEQEVVWHHPVKVGDSLKFTLSIERIEETPAGDLMTLLGRGFKDDLLMFEARMGFLVRRKTTSVKKKPTVKEGRELFRAPFQTNDGQQILYADASGDDNFIHTSHILARMAGLPRTILQGICVLAMTCSTLSEKLIDNDPTRLVSIKGRFVKVVIPGQKLVVVGYEGDSPSKILYEVVNPFGKRVIKNGVFHFRAG